MQLYVRAFGYALLSVIVVGTNRNVIAAPKQTVLKSESFDRDPGWEAHNNHILPEKPRTVTQDFGYDAATGEMGGRAHADDEAGVLRGRARQAEDAQRQAHRVRHVRAHANDRRQRRVLRVVQREPARGHRPADRLARPALRRRARRRAAGRAAAHRLQPAAAASSSRGSSGTARRRSKPRSGPRRSATTARATPGRSPTTPTPPAATGRCSSWSSATPPTPADFEGKPVTFDLPPGYKHEGATFDRFGLMNGTKPGGMMTIHFDDLSFDGKRDDFAADPGWVESGNRSAYEDHAVGAHDFGFSPGDEPRRRRQAPARSAATCGAAGQYALLRRPRRPAHDRTTGSRPAARSSSPSARPTPTCSSAGSAATRRTNRPWQPAASSASTSAAPRRVGHYFHPAFAVTPGKPRRRARGAGDAAGQGRTTGRSSTTRPRTTATARSPRRSATKP